MPVSVAWIVRVQDQHQFWLASHRPQTKAAGRPDRLLRGRLGERQVVLFAVEAHTR